MREIKFRAWSRKHQKMWHEIQTTAYFHAFIEDEDIEVLEYTGLKDKNGAEIYEGDIVRRHLNVAKTYDPESGQEDRDYRHPELVPFVGVVKLRYNGWRLDCRRPVQKPGGYGIIRAASLAHSKANSEAIGNIYENPELLEVKAK